MTDPLRLPPDIFTPELPDAPYPGLRPFEQDEWPLFFGRERVTREVIDRLLERRLVVVHGSSGCGKSSLIRAGVLSRLEQEHVRGGIAWRTCDLRPGDAPTYNLARAFAWLDSGNVDPDNIQRMRRLVVRGPKAAAALAEAVAATPEHRVCLLIDQFEELFRFARETSREQAALFASFLTGLVQIPPPPGLYAIITLRSEFLGHCAQFAGLAETINRSQYLLPPMSHTALMQAIREPAALYGSKIDRALAEWLIADADIAQDTLPLIQHALMLLWNQASGEGDTMSQRGLDLLGKQEGGVAALLSDHADRVMAAAAPDSSQQIIVERLFRALTDINAEGQGIRRPQQFGRLVAVSGGDEEALRLIIDAFRSEGVSFLTPYPPEPIEDGTVIDISHEALIRCWQRLADPKDGWLQREFQDGLIWRSLLAPADSFAKNPKNVLSPGLAEERGQWLKGCTPAWCERYGGSWERVNELIQASETAATTRLRFLEKLQQSFQYGANARNIGNRLEQVSATLSASALRMIYDKDISEPRDLMESFRWYDSFYNGHVRVFLSSEEAIYYKTKAVISSIAGGRSVLHLVDEIHFAMRSMQRFNEELNNAIDVLLRDTQNRRQYIEICGTSDYLQKICKDIISLTNKYLDELTNIFLVSF